MASEKSEGGRTSILWAGLIAAFAFVATFAFFALRNPEKAESTRPEAPPFAKLIGRWARGDEENYAILVRSVAEGQVDASYFNPAPIKVEKAEATRSGESLKLVLVLRDVNYPGSTYTLSYDAERDQLRGDYFQPQLRQRFQVVFVRYKE